MTKKECRAKLIMMGWMEQADKILILNSKIIRFSINEQSVQIYDPNKAYDNKHVIHRSYTNTIKWAINL